MFDTSGTLSDSPVFAAIAAHQAARARVAALDAADVPDGPVFDGAVGDEISTWETVVKAPCNDDGLFVKVGYIKSLANEPSIDVNAAIVAAVLHRFEERR